MIGIEYSEPELRADLYLPADDAEHEDVGCACFDVQAWAEAYLDDVEAQAEHEHLPGVPFH